MKKIGFLSFGHWTPSPQSGARSASDVLLEEYTVILLRVDYIDTPNRKHGMRGAIHPVVALSEELRHG